MLRSLWLLIPLLLLSKADDASSLGRSKAEKLRMLSSESGGMIDLTAETFTHYLLDQPRPYTLVVLFTTTSAKYKCTSCEEISEMLQEVAYSYKESGGEQPGISPTGQKCRAVFFGVLEYSQSTHSLYQKFGFVSVPNILISHPKSVLDEGTKFSVPREDLWEFSQASEVHTQKILEFVNSRTNRQMEIKISTLDAVMSLVYSLMFIGGFCALGYALRRVLLIPHVWWAGGMMVYFVCMAGVVYDIIHGVPWVGTNDKGEPEFINSGQRSQFGLEGFLMSFVICLGGLALIGINLSAKMSNPWATRAAGTFCLAVLVYTAYRTVHIYQIKASWYNPGMAPPSHYTKGPLIRDQGNSF